MLKYCGVVDHERDMGKVCGVRVKVIVCTIYKLYDVAVPSRRTGFIPTT
jgi:hypothetical protein